ncbi:MAG: hypothetical protein CL661_11205 [Bacteroidetes bacterium]|jgi:hypothetical protein|nr:hypothetical protein [Bacteroidota bacterium]|tara:strand:- start:1981 stop:3747 length:1767 start_codon:yes stop_codon:yes gene_type:complete
MFVIRILSILLLIFIASIIIKCAHPGTPIGGPKDVTPPQVVETSPENGSAMFNSNNFKVTFDEYVALVEIQQRALISPPMEDFPDFRIKGKSILVKFNEDLKPNTTYSVYFGDAIVDITENNPLINYTYLFSTGDYVDSLSLSGYIINAFDLKPVEGTYVMLYKDNNDTITFDSLPYLVAPYYLSKTDIDGRFQFSGLADDYYLLFALNDKNSSFIFDQPGEEIAFLDSLIKPVYVEIPKIDSIIVDSLANIDMASDSIIVDDESFLFETDNNDVSGEVDLFLFLSPDTLQRLMKAEVIVKNTIRFSFSQPATNVEIKSLKFSPDSIWYVQDFSLEKDTLYWYLNNPPIDSLELLLTQFDDTLGIAYLKLDTKKRSARLRKKDVEKKEKLGWKSNISGSNLDLNQDLEIEFSQPFVKLNTDSSLLVIGTDSIWNPDFKFSDSLQMKIIFPFDLTEETKYRIYFPDSSFTSWNNIHTDAIDLKFSTLKLSDYGIFTFELYPEKKQNYILQMLSEKETVLRELYFTKDTSVTFDYLRPAIYYFKIIYDSNKNNSWDPGNYSLKIQPETVIYFPKEIKVRANWEIEETWIW